MPEIKFPRAFEEDKYVPINIGRIKVGNHVMRLMFCLDGKTRAYITKSAIEDGSVVLLPNQDDLLITPWPLDNNEGN